MKNITLPNMNKLHDRSTILYLSGLVGDNYFQARAKIYQCHRYFFLNPR
jgi:hypothetical protein